MIISSKGKADDIMKRVVSFILATALCGCMMVATPLTACYVEDSTYNSSSSSESGENNNEPPTNPLPSADAQLPKGEIS